MTTIASETAPARSPGTVSALVLHLVLTYHWFEEVSSGRKCIEYRAMTPFWTRRIWDRRDKIKKVRFQRGYERDPLRTARVVTKIDIGPCPYDGWNGNYYRIYFTMPNAEAHGRAVARTVQPLVGKSELEGGQDGR